MIRIGVDGRLLQGNLTGVGKYVTNLLIQIIDTNPGVTVVILTNKLICNNDSRFQIIYDKSYMAKVKPMLWSRFFLGRLINKNQIDIFFSGDGFIPFFIKVKGIISVIHDLNHLLVPETMSSLRLLTTRLFFKRDVFKASYIIANSKGTADKLKSYINKEVDVIIYPLIDKWYRILDKEVVNKALEEFNICFPYILTVATQEPRKNLVKTIEAFISLKKGGKIPFHKLLLVGSKGWKSSLLQSIIGSNKDIISMGYTDDDKMPYLYNGADLFVFPSKYEGFGMPPREALLCGTNVVVSDIPELREATFGLGLYINPEDRDQFEQAIIEGIENENVFKELENSYYKKETEQLSVWIKNTTYNA